MARYKLMADDGEGDREVGGQRKSTKKDIEQWIKDNVNAMGLDWRAGYLIKFRDCPTVYTWRWINDGRTVSV